METDREELLNRLHKLPFCMRLTALTSEYCIEVNVTSSKGTSYSWEGFDDFDFPAYYLKGMSKNKIALIKEHILSKSLYLSDFNRTQLKKIISVGDDSKELSEVFVNFLELPDEKIESLYCYKDVDTGRIYVGDTEEKISDILNELYQVDTPWDSLSDEQLGEYLEEYEDADCEIPFSQFE